jgi:squalene-associated FAD-dependent desaturase
MTGPRIVVVGGGLAGITAALDAADAGATVTLLERRRRLGGLTWSFEHDGRQVDNGQHVFLRCCTAYLRFLDRIGSRGDVTLQDRLAIDTVEPAAPGRPRRAGGLRRNGLPAPLHLGPALARYPHLPVADRLRIGLAAVPLRRLDLDDPALDTETFAAWLGRHGQRPATIPALWDLITMATINLPAAEASLAMGAKVFQTGILTDASAGDIGWSLLPLGDLHGRRAAAALERSDVTVRLDERVTAVKPADDGWEVTTGAGVVPADGVIVAVPHTGVADILPPDALARQDAVATLGTSAIVNVHVVYDRAVTTSPLTAGIGTRIQWVFDRTVSSGLAASGLASSGGQYLAVTISAADDLLGHRPDDIAADACRELAELFPAARQATVVDTLVTKERTATFRAVPGSGALRPLAATRHPGLAVAGAWTDTGWPATMEGAVRSGYAASAAILAPVRAHRLPAHSAVGVAPAPSVAPRPVPEEVG